MTPAVSVVIGFKDWGLERLQLSVESIHESLKDIPHEVIIADYGSEDSEAVAVTAAAVEAVHEKVLTDGEWSRSRALNAGVRASQGEIILATDADMLFTPGALSRVVEQIRRHPQEIVILQCRDLPTGYSHEVVRREGHDWDRYASIGQIRPRWGMGGLVGVRRVLWDRLRGWDERMHTYGGEDVDFGKRAQKMGSRIDWLDEPGVGMYHIWHPSSSASAARSPEAMAAIAQNRKIHMTDMTFARNRVSHRYLPAQRPPLVSVIVGETQESEVSELTRTVTSLLAQTVADIEVLIPQGAPTIKTDDPRVIRIGAETKPCGIVTGFARPGDLWAESRAEDLLDHWTPGVALLADRTTVQVREDGVPVADAEPLLGATVHPAGTLVRTELLFGSVPGTPAAWTTAIAQAAASGADWVLSPKIGRLETVDIATEEERTVERASGATELETALRRAGLEQLTLPAVESDSLGVVATAVRDGLGLTVSITARSPRAVRALNRLTGTETASVTRTSSISTLDRDVLEQSLIAQFSHPIDATELLRHAREEGLDASLLQDMGTDDEMPHAALLTLVDRAEALHATGQRASTWIACTGTEDSVRTASDRLRAVPGLTTVIERAVEFNGTVTNWTLARTSHQSLDAALRVATVVCDTTRTVVIDLAGSTPGKDL